MFEAVGLRNYDEVFGACDRLVASDGSTLLQTITIPDQLLAGYKDRVDWIQTYIFPGSELASVAEVHRSLARVTQFSPMHVENFGLHDAATLAIWRERFIQNLDTVRLQGFDDKLQRMWEFYLGWCKGAFRERYVNVAQLLLTKNGSRRPLFGDPVWKNVVTSGASAR